MRIVFSTVPSYSHFTPIMLPLAVAARDAGHEVAVATSDELSEEIRNAGLEPLPLPNVMSFEKLLEQTDMSQLPVDPSVMAEVGRKTLNTPPAMFAGLFIGHLASRSAADLIDVLPGWKPDLIVRECSEYGSYLAAEKLGLPHVALDIAPMGDFEAPEVLKQINIQRSELGLAEIDDALDPFRNGRLCVIPELYYRPGQRLPSARYYRTDEAPSGERLDPAIAGLPGDRPLVLATLGSNAERFLGEGRSVLDTIVEVLGDLPVTGVVALGKNQSSSDWQGARPGNVHLTSFVQQKLLLPACDAFITHGGFNGTREALSSGVPMVTLPLFAEQPANAERVEELGAGRRLNVEDVTHESLSTAVRAVVEDPSYRRRARQVQRAVLGLPGLDQLVRDLEDLASSAAAAT